MKTKRHLFQGFFFYLSAVIMILIYFFGIRRLLPLEMRSLVEGIVLVGLLVTATITLITLIITLFIFIFSNHPGEKRKSLINKALFLLATLSIFVGIIAASQWLAYTPKIIADNGTTPENSIASIEKINLGGVDQWLIIRGEDVNKPVLLFLSGGPGASESARVLRFNQELEKHFVVVIWEQRGCGKSYPSINPKEDLTIDQYTNDIVELTKVLRERFDEEKIYLVGHSWGTIIGVSAVQAKPDLFYAYIGSAQMVDIKETDQIIYDMVMEHSIQSGDTEFVQTLKAQGPPPYFGKSPIQPYSTLFGREYAIYEYPNIKNEEYRQDGDIMMLMLKQPEYGWMDRVYYLLGLMNTYNVVYPQLQEIDFRESATRFDLPVYLMLGKNDMNNPMQLPEEYFNRIKAPSKQLFLFEDSGHGMIWEEADLYHSIMIDIILEETYSP